jgi:energy-coupling factor transport system ATP-binding protein
VPEPLVCAESFSFRYAEAREPTLRDIDLALEPGSFTVLAGASGSGKSTLLRALCGLVPHFHGGEAAGALEVGGLSVREHGPADLARVCGVVMQDPERQVVLGGVRAEISLPLEHRGEPPGSVARAVEEVALALGIERLLDRRTDTLSGGELQRVALAAALVHRPALLLLDEPASQLDPVAGGELVWLLRRLNEDWGTAVVVAEHRLERCLPAADRVLALERGTLVSDAAPRDFLARAPEGLGTPLGRLFERAGLRPPPASVKQARDAVRAAGLLDEARLSARAPEGRRRRGARAPALALRGAWLEIEEGPTVLRGVELRFEAGERVALMGRNGAGKSTLLRLAKGLLEPTRGRVERGGTVALLLQNPGDYLVHERVEEEAGAAALASAGLAGRKAANPRDLSGGERQRLALEVALGTGAHGAVLLDEPTRGMDHAHKDALAARVRALAGGGAAVLVATHDTEFAATFAERVVLLGEGVVIADGSPAEVLGGGWHFSTDVARVTDGAALTPADGAALLRRELVL